MRGASAGSSVPRPTIYMRASEEEPCDRERESSHAHCTNDEGSDGSRDKHRKLQRGADVKHNNQPENRIDGVALCLALKRAYEL